MFSQANLQIRESLYGIWARTRQKNIIYHSNGSGFMIAPNYIVTTAHVLHLHNEITNPLHREIRVIRSPDIGQQTEITTFYTEDKIRDLAFLQIDKPRSNQCVTLENNLVPNGTICGCLGFPLAKIQQLSDRLSFNLIERFQGAFISAFFTENNSGRDISWYEIDREMYDGSSGCLGYLSNANVIGVQARVLREESNDDVPLKERKKLEISLWIPSTDVITFGKNHNII